MSGQPDGRGGRTGTRDTMARVADVRDHEARAESAAGRRRTLGRKLTGDEILRLCLLAWLIVFVGGAIGFAASWLVQQQYGARSEILYSLREDQPTGFLREDRNLTTQVVLIDSRTVLGPVALANGLTVDALADKVTASVAEGSEVIEIEVRDPDRGAGLRLVDAITTQYLALANSSVDESRRYLRRQVAAVEARLSEPGLSAGQRAALASRRSDLLVQLDTVTLAGPQARRLGSSYTTSGPVTPRRSLAAAAGALCGLLIAAVVIAILAQRWRRQ